MGINPAGMHVSLEAYDHLGKINTGSINLDERYRELTQNRRVFLTVEEADLIVHYSFSAPAAVVWDWLIDPPKRTRWFTGSFWKMKERPFGRTGPAAKNHCTTSQVIEQILDWRPFEYYTVSLSKGFFNMIITGELESTEFGTQFQWRMRLNRSLPRWFRRRFCRRIDSKVWHLKENFGLMDHLIEEARKS